MLSLQNPVKQSYKQNGYNIDIKGEDMSPGDCGSGSDHMISCC
jgi:hypothetical protein